MKACLSLTYFILATVRWDMNLFSCGKSGERILSICFCNSKISSPPTLSQTIRGFLLCEKMPTSWSLAWNFLKLSSERIFFTFVNCSLDISPRNFSVR